MSTTRDMRAVMRQYDLTEPMVRAIFSGADDAVIDCNWRTKAALVERRLVHRTMSNLTPEGRDVLGALKAAEGVIEQATPAAVETPAPKVVEGIVVSHTGTAKGCLPKHADDDSDTRAAIEALFNQEDQPAADEPLARFAVTIGPDEREWIGFHEYDRAVRCAVQYGLGPDAVHDRQAPERLRDDLSYAIQWGTDDGQWHGSIVSSAMSGRDEIDAYVADVQALAAPGVTLRAVEIRLTHTVLPAPTTPKPTDVRHGPVAARTLRSGCRINLFDTDRLICRVEYLHVGNYLRLHTVPPAGEHPGYFVFTKSPHDLVELISRGPAVDITGTPVVDSS